MASYTSQYTGTQIDTVIGNALLRSEAQSTYLSITNANTNFLTKNDAASTYLSLNNVSDYIIEEGTATGTVTGNGNNMTWNYIKWNSGLAMCYGTATTVRSSAVWGNIYYANNADPYWTFPTNLFIATPTFYASIQQTPESGGPKWFWISMGGTTNSTRTCQIITCCANEYSNQEIKVGMVAWGRWKN